MTQPGRSDVLLRTVHPAHSSRLLLLTDNRIGSRIFQTLEAEVEALTTDHRPKIRETNTMAVSKIARALLKYSPFKDCRSPSTIFPIMEKPFWRRLDNFNSGEWICSRMGLSSTIRNHSNFKKAIHFDRATGLYKRNFLFIANGCNPRNRSQRSLFCFQSIFSSEEKWKLETSD